jgi:hypothetical protein
MALHATTIRFADRAYMAIARAADAQGISVSQYVREAALIRAVLDELDSAEEALHTAHDLLAVAREVRRLAEVDPPGPPRRAHYTPRPARQLRVGGRREPATHLDLVAVPQAHAHSAVGAERSERPGVRRARPAGVPRRAAAASGWAWPAGVLAQTRRGCCRCGCPTVVPTKRPATVRGR